MDFSKTLTLDDGFKLTGKRAFNTMVKPIGSVCNLDCCYCYYLDKAALYQGKEPKMSLELLELFVKQHIEANDVPVVTFNWHGGEPLLMGLDFYKKAIEYELHYASGKKIENTIQTNATLITPEWANFLKDNNFLVGVSIDGPKDIHDKNRRGKGGSGTWERVIKGIETLYKTGTQYNTLTTINKNSEGRGLEVYQFLKSIGSCFMQFLPVMEHVKIVEGQSHPVIVAPDVEGATISPWSVTAEGFGKFMCDIFDYWVRHDVSYVYVQMFDATLARYVGASPGLCVFEETCGGNAVIEHNGDVYVCDHFVYQQYKMGNIKEKPLREILSQEKQFAFGIDKRNTLPRECLNCNYFFACHGACPKHRFKNGKNTLCEGYKMFYRHSEDCMKFMANELVNGRAPKNIMNNANYFLKV